MNAPDAAPQTREVIPNRFEGIDRYRTPSGARAGVLARLAPSAVFYPCLYRIVSRAGGLAQRGLYDGRAWVESSCEVFDLLERLGATIEVEGFSGVAALEGPAVIVANHMSTLETFVLPALLRPLRPLTFVVKESLLHYPVFGAVMRAVNPIAVGRESPRHDLVTVMGEGTQRLRDGMSVVVFPQTTRTEDFDPAQFNSIGAKLAARAGVPLIPLALSTHAWGQGRFLKDFGKIRPERPVRFSFGAPLEPEGKGDAAHRAATEYIARTLAGWRSRAP